MEVNSRKLEVDAPEGRSKISRREGSASSDMDPLIKLRATAEMARRARFAGRSRELYLHLITHPPND